MERINTQLTIISGGNRIDLHGAQPFVERPEKRPGIADHLVAGSRTANYRALAQEARSPLAEGVAMAVSVFFY